MTGREFRRIIGGFAATRSSGQASAGYGRFDRMVVGLRAATPVGTLDRFKQLRVVRELTDIVAATTGE